MDSNPVFPTRKSLLSLSAPELFRDMRTHHARLWPGVWVRIFQMLLEKTAKKGQKSGKKKQNKKHFYTFFQHIVFKLILYTKKNKTSVSICFNWHLTYISQWHWYKNSAKFDLKRDSIPNRKWNNKGMKTMAGSKRLGKKVTMEKYFYRLFACHIDLPFK